MSSKDFAPAFRRLADAMETASIDLETWSGGDEKEPYVMIHALSDSHALWLARELGLNGDAGYDKTLHRMEFDLAPTGIRGYISYPAITVPRACPFCDEKHDCTHVDGMVAR